MVDMILFPSSFFDFSKVDQDLQEEYNTVVDTGLFDITLFHYGNWFQSQKLTLTKTPDRMYAAVYRGWMMKPEQYSNFYQLLLEKNIKLVTTPQEYELMHIFPNVYGLLKENTAKIETYPLHSEIEVARIKRHFRRFILKDYVKSVKGTDFPAYFDQSTTQSEFDHWMEVFYQYRGNLLTGGICIKEFLDLKKYGSKTNEYRVFYINHQIASVSRNSGQNADTPMPPQQMLEKYRNLPSVYYTIDYAELDNGSWTIIEAGDGSVSGLSEGLDYTQYFRSLYQCFQ